MRFPPVPALGIAGADLDFRYAKGLDMHRHVSGKSWSYEPDVLAMLLCLLGGVPKSRFINVGANIGYFALLAQKLFGNRVEVHAYEPMPELFERLGKAKRSNDVKFHVSDAALADFEGHAPFHLSAKSDTSNSLNPDFRPAKDIVEVKVTTLDREFPATKRPGVLSQFRTAPADTTVLLIDTESTEPAVLRGGLAFIERERPAIICEVLAGRTEDDLSAIIDRIGYVPYALTDEGPELRTEVVGDRSYQHRDWLFLPADVAPPSTERFVETFRVLTSTRDR